MKVVTKSVVIENEEFVLVKVDNEFYGTISVKDLDENGALKRGLNGFDMCVGDTTGGALRRRKNHILCERFLNEHPEVDLPNRKGIDKYVKFLYTLDFNY